MMYTENKIYDEACKKWGLEKQLIAAVEEFAELSQILCKVSVGKKWKKEDLIDELADATIMIRQTVRSIEQELDGMTNLGAKVNARKAYKLKRLIERIEEK